MKTCSECVYWSPNQGPVEQAEYGLYQCENLTLKSLKTVGTFGCNEFVGADSTMVNVPNHLKRGTMTDPNPNPVDGPTEILIVTYHKDQPWLEYALKCIQKHCRGFQGVTVATPHPAMRGMVGPYINEAFFEMANKMGPVRVTPHYYDEIPGKGFLQHEIKLASPEECVPDGTKYVLTCDADCCFHTPSSPEHFAWNDKPYWIIRSWESLTTEDPRNPGSKVVSDCAQWRPVTDEQLGFASEVYSMCVNVQMMPVALLQSYRDHIRSVHSKPFSQYMLEGRNEFPQSRTDYNAMGAFFYKFHRDQFHWFDVEKPPYPSDRKLSFWSHGGITPTIRDQIEGFLK